MSNLFTCTKKTKDRFTFNTHVPKTQQARKHKHIAVGPQKVSQVRYTVTTAPQLEESQKMKDFKMVPLMTRITHVVKIKYLDCQAGGTRSRPRLPLSLKI